MSDTSATSVWASVKQNRKSSSGPPSFTGLNLRHANFHVNPMCYGLRERDRSQDVAAEPWRSGTSGWRTERDRIDKFLDDYAPNSLGESLPARLPTSVRDNMKESTKGPGPDFRRHFNKKDRGYFVNELPTGDFNHEDYREKAHPDTAKGSPKRQGRVRDVLHILWAVAPQLRPRGRGVVVRGLVSSIRASRRGGECP